MCGNVRAIGGGLVLAGVIDDDHQVDDALGHHFVVGPLERPRGIVGGHDDDDFFVVEHQSPEESRS